MLFSLLLIGAAACGGTSSSEDTAATPTLEQPTPASPGGISDRQQAQLVMGSDDVIGHCPETAKYRMLERFVTRESGGSPPRALPVGFALRIPYTWALERLVDVERKRSGTDVVLGTGSLATIVYYFDSSGTAQEVVKMIAGNVGLEILQVGDFTTAGYQVGVGEVGEEDSRLIILRLLAGKQHLVTVFELMSGRLDELCSEEGVNELIVAAGSNIESIPGAGPR